MWRSIRILSEPSESAGLEDGNQECVVAGICIETPRAKNARKRNVGIRGDRGLHACQYRAHVFRDKLSRTGREALVEVNVRPGRQLG